MKTKLLALMLAALIIPSAAHAFNLITDIQQQTQWTIGSAASGGTAMALAKNDAFNLKAGDFVPSALASIVQYRMLSIWWGGNQYKLADGTSVWKDSAKLGFNVAYFLKNFTNQPPAVIQNLVIGPSASFNLVTTPHIFVPFLDINYQFSSGK